MIDILFAGFYSCRRYCGSHIQERMGFSHFWYKMDRKNPIVQKLRAIYRQQMPCFLIPGRRKKIQQRQQKDSKTETSVESSLQNIRKNRIWMQQLKKARAKQRNLTEVLVAAGRRDPCLRKGTRYRPGRGIRERTTPKQA